MGVADQLIIPNFHYGLQCTLKCYRNIELHVRDVIQIITVTALHLLQISDSMFYLSQIFVSSFMYFLSCLSTCVLEKGYFTYNVKL